MKALHVIPSLSPVHGGPSFAMALIAESLARAGVEVDVATTDDDGRGRHATVSHGVRTERNGYGVLHFPKQTEFYKVSLPFKRWMTEHVCEYDLVHVHALFSHTSNCAARVARRARVPYVVRPLGVLNRWGMENRRAFIKALSFRLIERPILRRAAAIHYTSRQEEREAEELGVRAKGAIVPLGIDVERFRSLPDREEFFQQFPAARDRDVILFLSRIDPKKGIELLLPAFARVHERRAETLLVIAGDGKPEYVSELRESAKRLRLESAVLWTGRLEGRDKMAAFAAATVFALPSYSENFGIALVEALAAGLPCVTTEGVAVSDDICERDAGIVVRAETAPLVEALDRLLSSASLRMQVSANARQLTIERFSMQAMGSALALLYGQFVTPKRDTDQH